MGNDRKHKIRTSSRQINVGRLRYIDPEKVKRLLGNIFPYRVLAKLIDVDLVALNNEAVVRMGGGGRKAKLPSRRIPRHGAWSC
jgi:hypothetical protein